MSAGKETHPAAPAYHKLHPTLPADVEAGFGVETFRLVMGGFATGVSIITAASTAGECGITVNSLTSVSLDPMWLSISLTPRTPVAAAVEETGRFVVNLLDESQEHLSRHFAARESSTDLSVVAYRPDEDGVPVFAGGLGYIRCRVVRVDDGGDHRVFVADAIGGESRRGEPLVVFRGRYRRLA